MKSKSAQYNLLSMQELTREAGSSTSETSADLTTQQAKASFRRRRHEESRGALVGAGKGTEAVNG